MKNDFKNYFELNRHFEALKINNDFKTNSTLSKKRKFVILLLSFGCFYFIKKLFESHKGRENILFNLKFRYYTRKNRFTIFSANKQEDFYSLISSYMELMKLFEENIKVFSFN